MRRWHRWIGVGFAAFLLVIGGTGVAIQVLDLIAAKDRPDAAAKPNVAAAAVHGDGTRPADSDHASDADDSQKRLRQHIAADIDRTQPATALSHTQTPKQPQSALRQWNHWIKDLHSGVLLGPVGIFISILSGLAMLFFAVSGMWMYWQMFTRRKTAGRTSFFWKR